MMELPRFDPTSTAIPATPVTSRKMFGWAPTMTPLPPPCHRVELSAQQQALCLEHLAESLPDLVPSRDNHNHNNKKATASTTTTTLQLLPLLGRSTTASTTATDTSVFQQALQRMQQTGQRLHDNNNNKASSSSPSTTTPSSSPATSKAKKQMSPLLFATSTAAMGPASSPRTRTKNTHNNMQHTAKALQKLHAMCPTSPTGRDEESLQQMKRSRLRHHHHQTRAVASPKRSPQRHHHNAAFVLSSSHRQDLPVVPSMLTSTVAPISNKHYTNKNVLLHKSSSAGRLLSTTTFPRTPSAGRLVATDTMRRVRSSGKILF